MRRHGTRARQIPWTISSTVCVVALIMIWSDWGGIGTHISQYFAPKPAIGGAFHLTATHGTPISDTDLPGKPTALFFGYTFCPDVCPTTLYEASSWLAKLGPDGDAIRILFVTVDPERDTLEHLRAYMSAFDPRITGLTGSRKQIDQIVQAFRITADRTDIDSEDPQSYLISHTASVFLLDRNGAFVDSIGYREDTATALAKIRHLIRHSSEF